LRAKNNETIEIIDLNEENKELYFVCLEDWSEEFKEAGNHKECWYNRMKGKNLGVKLAKDKNGEIGGMIQYIPIEHSFVDGNDLYFVQCIWVHGYKHGRGNFQRRGMGKALLKAAEEDVRNRGARGIAAWGLSLPIWMKASWFKRQGYKKVDKKGIRVLLWKPFTNDAVPPKWVKQQKNPVPIPGKVLVTAFLNGWCQAMNIVYERAKRAAAELSDKVVFQVIDTSDREVFKEWGISDAVFIDDKELRSGPPPSYEKVKKRIAKKVKKLKI
jgi:GNAT superfamily N-acetyltransferase